MSFQIDFPAQPRFPILAPDGTAAAPSYSFAGDTNFGFYRVAADTLGLAANGVVGIRFSQGVIDIPYDIGLLRFGASSDTILTREAANTLALRNSTNAQTFRVYNTYTDASNYERGFAGWSLNIFFVGAEAGGTGTKRPTRISGGGIDISPLAGTTTAAWHFNSTGHFLANADNTYDFGGPSNRARSVYIGTNVIMSSAGSYNWDARSVISSPSDGVIRLSNNAGTDFTRLQFGGTTSSFPSLGRSGTTLQCSLADGSSRAPFTCSILGASGAVKSYETLAIPAGGAQSVGFMVSSTADFGVFFGSGAPTLSAAKGSLYLRSDGSGVADRMYVNTDGGTTWTAVATVA